MHTICITNYVVYDNEDAELNILTSRNSTTQNTFAGVHVCMRFSGVNHFTPVFVSKISIRTGSIASCSQTVDKASSCEGAFLVPWLQKICTYKHIRSGEKAVFIGLFTTSLV